MSGPVGFCRVRPSETSLLEEAGGTNETPLGPGCCSLLEGDGGGAVSGSCESWLNGGVGGSRLEAAFLGLGCKPCFSFSGLGCVGAAAEVAASLRAEVATLDLSSRSASVNEGRIHSIQLRPI